MAVGSLYLFEHESTEGSCLYLGFSENSIALAADTLLRNTNKDGRANKGSEFELLRDEGWSSARCSCPDVEERPCMFSHVGQLRTRLILRHLLIALKLTPGSCKRPTSSAEMGFTEGGFRSDQISCRQMS